MDFKYDQETGLELTPVGEAVKQLYLKDVEWINFGKRDSEGVNLCDSIEGLYYWATEEIALEGVEATALLLSDGALPSLNVDFKLLKSGPLMISWNYAKKPDGWKEPWTVPDSVLNIDKTLAEGEEMHLSDYIVLNKNESLLTVKDGKNGAKVFDLRGMVL